MFNFVLSPFSHGDLTSRILTITLFRAPHPRASHRVCWQPALHLGLGQKRRSSYSEQPVYIWCSEYTGSHRMEVLQHRSTPHLIPVGNLSDRIPSASPAAEKCSPLLSLISPDERWVDNGLCVRLAWLYISVLRNFSALARNNCSCGPILCVLL